MQFKPTFNSTQAVCSIICAKAKASQDESIKQRKDLRERKEKLKTKGEHAKEAQAAVNKFIRLRDAKEPCISCQRNHSGQIHAGHYLSIGARPNLRFHEQNIHAQCAPCNNHLSGNLVNYRINLIKKIGLLMVEHLESDQAPSRHDIESLQSIKTHYRKLVRELENAA